MKFKGERLELITQHSGRLLQITYYYSVASRLKLWSTEARECQWPGMRGHNTKKVVLLVSQYSA
jgi:hypothetical protein